MTCFHCGKKIENERKKVRLNCDGDSVCDQTCADGYEKDKAHFFNVVIHDDDKMRAWWGSS